MFGITGVLYIDLGRVDPLHSPQLVSPMNSVHRSDVHLLAYMGLHTNMLCAANLSTNSMAASHILAPRQTAQSM